MENFYHGEEQQRVAEGRTSFSGHMQTDRQYEDFMAITGIIQRQLEETGSHVEPLKNFSETMARTERIDWTRAENIIRDLFKIRTGMTMNEMRETLLEKQKQILDPNNPDADRLKQTGYQAALASGQMVKEGTKVNFYRALAHEAAQFATEHGVTHVGAKQFIAECFKETENQELREWGKELDNKYYRPQIDAEKQKQSRPRQQSLSLSR